ncbi:MULTISPECIES: WS/DGAT domain-containing protein [Mycobacteriaceae]|uniref:WS/DGAT domain-containing protein n=1 Tax=Mycobacteriaceae TaxID=1762 RepID=UPI0007FF1E3F|nr:MULTISPECIES: WS/DGAT domain-containing protein [Mycobacteriaceae]MCK0173022.1 WSD1 family O-acyltransferase [Mycolicibacterium sp. F2034L]OBB57929.1 DUF1298 domain-containing protein [Mycobacterium sp. 852013-51886_SCH5428379]
MTVRRLAAVDAQTYWLSAKVPSDQFLTYAFAGAPDDLSGAVDAVLRRAASCADLTLRVQERRAGYPVWASAAVDERHAVVHRLDGADWTDCLTAVEALADEQLDARQATWQVHLFPSISGVPGVDDVGTVAVVQMAHALADGVRGAALAAWMFGRDDPVPVVPSPPRWESAVLPWRAIRAARTHRQLVRDVAAARVAPQGESFPLLRSNARPDGARSLRTLVRHRSGVSGPTVTVGVLTAIGEALAAHLGELGDDTSRLGAEVPMAKGGQRPAHNHFGNMSVGLFPGLPPAERARRIAAVLADRRRRAAHPAMIADRAASAATPARLLRWGVAQFDPDVRAAQAIGNTVVSSVHRGPADLRFGGAPVVLTTDSMPLSPMMGLTHGVHGIGDTVTVSVHAAQSAIGDVDAYTERLAEALDRQW